MDTLSSIITAGVVILAIALMTYATGRTLVSLPVFGGDPNLSGQQVELAFNTTMDSVQTNAGTAFNILSVSPLVLGAAVIIGILIGAFAYVQFKD